MNWTSKMKKMWKYSEWADFYCIYFFIYGLYFTLGNTGKKGPRTLRGPGIQDSMRTQDPTRFQDPMTTQDPTRTQDPYYPSYQIHCFDTLKFYILSKTSEGYFLKASILHLITEASTFPSYDKVNGKQLLFVLKSLYSAFTCWRPFSK